MKRRAFFGRLFGGAAVVAVAPVAIPKARPEPTGPLDLDALFRHCYNLKRKREQEEFVERFFYGR